MTALRKTPQSPAERDPRWVQLAAKDHSADGRFYYAVTTTGIYCRPSCPSRRPHRRNVTFFRTPAEAEEAGFRACRRCKPEGVSLAQRRSDAIVRACRMIEGAESRLATAALARAVGLSTYHFHRTFKAVTGLTPGAYAQAQRARRLREGLAKSPTVISAAFDAGFNAASRFYEKSPQMLGMTPSAFRRGGAGEEIRYAVGRCSLGAVLVASSRRGICAIALGDDPKVLVHELKERFPHAALTGGDKAFKSVVKEVIAFVERPSRGLDLPLDVRGTAFQERVWRVLREIPAGRKVTYTELAQSLGAPSSVRAVASACAANCIAVAIPCHRVLRRGGGLAGYRWGVERKRVLLAREATRK